MKHNCEIQKFDHETADWDSQEDLNNHFAERRLR